MGVVNRHHGGFPMRHRHAISDDDWARIKDLLPGRSGGHGKVAKDNRRFINAILWIGKTGAPWRDLPERLGHWNSTWRRFDRWARKGVWERVFEALQDPDLEWLILDSTIIRAHPCAAGAPKKATGPAASPSRPSAAAAAGSARRFMAPSAGWGCRSDWS
jgi:transposase